MLGDSTAEEYSFRVGELVAVCGKSTSVCLQSSVYIVIEFHPHIGFVVCFHKSRITMHTHRRFCINFTLISYLPSNLPFLPHTTSGVTVSSVPNVSEIPSLLAPQSIVRLLNNQLMAVSVLKDLHSTVGVQVFSCTGYWIHKSTLCTHILHEFVVLLEAKLSAKPQTRAIYRRIMYECGIQYLTHCTLEMTF